MDCAQQGDSRFRTDDIFNLSARAVTRRLELVKSTADLRHPYGVHD